MLRFVDLPFISSADILRTSGSAPTRTRNVCRETLLPPSDNDVECLWLVKVEIIFIRFIRLIVFIPSRYPQQNFWVMIIRIFLDHHYFRCCCCYAPRVFSQHLDRFLLNFIVSINRTFITENPYFSFLYLMNSVLISPSSKSPLSLLITARVFYCVCHCCCEISQTEIKLELQKSRDASVTRAGEGSVARELLQRCWTGGGNKDGGVTPLKVKHFNALRGSESHLPRRRVYLRRDKRARSAVERDRRGAVRVRWV